MPANEQLIQRLLNVYGNDTQSIRHALSGLKGNVYEDGGNKPNAFMRVLMHGAYNNPELAGGGQWFNTATGYKQDSEGNVYQDENAWKDDAPEQKLRTGLALSGASPIVGTLAEWYPVVSPVIDPVLAIDGARNVITDNGIRKTINHAKSGEYVPMLKSAAGDILDITGGVGTARKALSYSKPLLRNFYTNRINSGIVQAVKYKTSDNYRKLFESAKQEAKEMGFGDLTEEAYFNNAQERPPVRLARRTPESSAEYFRGDNIIEVDPFYSADTKIDGYHEGLHWQNVGRPQMYIGPKYDKWREAYKAHKPQVEQDALWSEMYYDTDEWRRLSSRNTALKYNKQKVSDALVSNPKDPYLTNLGELQVNGLEIGKHLGIKPFSKYPGDAKMKDIVTKAREYKPYFEDVKSDTPNDLQNFWKILTGNYTPVIGAGLLGGASAVTTYPTDYTEYKSGGRIYIKPSHRGRFTSLLKRTGKSASWFKAHGTPAQKRMATFALNSRHWKHEDGGPIQRAISSNKADVVLAAIRKMKSNVTP